MQIGICKERRVSWQRWCTLQSKIGGKRVYAHIKGVDYNNIFSLVVNHYSIIFLLALVAWNLFK